MTSNDARPSGCTGYTPFEKELVNAMRDFANSTDTPDFAPATIMRGGARRRTRSLVTAGIAAALILVGGGTAFAVTGGSGLNPGYKAPATSHLETSTGAAPTACAEPATGQVRAAAHKLTTGAAPTASAEPATGQVRATAHKLTTGAAPTACAEPATGQVPAVNR